MIEEGKKAPAFNLENKDGESVRLTDFDAEYLVLYFYPKDNTPGCTVEAQGFSRDLAKYRKLDTEVIGISGGDQKSKESFCSKNKLKITLLSDGDFKVAKKYGVYGPKKFMGKTYQGIHRTTFVLNKQRKVIKVFDKVSPTQHSKEVLEFVKSLKN